MNHTLNLRTTARQIFERTLAAIEVEAVVRSHFHLINNKLVIGEEVCDLARFSRVIVIGIGKASVGMARAVESILGERLTAGMVVTNALTGDAPKRMRVWLGGHPLPNAMSLAAADAALELLRATDDENTLMLFLISGGGSALFEKPIDDRLTLADLQAINQTLVSCGAVISEMNIVRRRLSAVKGGRLAQAAPRSRQISLYISDVNTDDLATIASGPTLPETATQADFERIIARYDLLRQFLPHVASFISSLISSDTAPGKQQPNQSSHHLLLDNHRALIEAQRIAAREYGFVVEVADALIEGGVEEMAQTHLARLAALREKHKGRAVCLLSGGEVICPVRGRGQGGRNQEFALRAALALHPASPDNIAVLSAGTDGVDGNSLAAGAVADTTTLHRALALGLSPEQYLRDSNSYHFFNALNDAIITGPTGNNVRDLRVLLACPHNLPE